MFTEKEREYIGSQRLARLATVSSDGQPDVSPVGYDFDGEHFFVGGMDLARTRKYRNVEAGNTRAALVIDDLVTVDPWHPRGVRVYGTVELVQREGYLGEATYLKITPTISWSWNVDDAGDGRRRAVHQHPRR